MKEHFKLIAERKYLMIKELNVCPLCHSKVIVCAFCGKKTIIDYKCSQCGKVLPLDHIIEELAKTVTP